ncbi:Retroelement pol polyprotein-like [Rhynchospora pubera]|uniref:Retroelement pol polyprotein-like n=1 Tax=Rhynchospora pubera TaxID=906938 RepID=A0AAV8C7S5_9POAL|nr:Retroelement pol polyprotein-like [Rhynchospora pubera]
MGDPKLPKKEGDQTVKRFIDSTSPFYLNSSDNPGMSISSCILKENNYDMWVKVMKNALSAKKKLGFVDGTITEPTELPESELWGTCNHMLVSWLFNSIDPVLQPSIAYFETAKELWDDLRDRFSVGNAPRIHQLKSDIAAAKQQGQSVVTYYTRLKGMWDELSSYIKVPTCTCKGCTCNLTAVFLKEKEEEKIHQFLMGLEDSIFGTVRSQILGMDPLPNLSRVYSMVVQEERHRTVVRGRDDRREAVGFAVQVNRPEVNQHKGGAGERVVCTHCNKPGHEVSRCFEIIGYPEGWGRGGRGTRGRGGKGRGRGRMSAHAVHAPEIQSAVSDTVMQPKIPGLSDVQLQQIMAILQNSNHGASSDAAEKLQGNLTNTAWLVDSGASHHMTGNFECLRNVHKILPSSVVLPNGGQTSVELEGSVYLCGGLILKRVLYVPCLNCNLISVSELLKDNNCFATFTHGLCVVQDLISRMLIGVGEMKDGIYYYHAVTPVQANCAMKQKNSMLWHRRMGHPSMYVTNLLAGVNDDGCNFKSVCEICLQAKQTRDVFPVSQNKVAAVFDLIHCDVWGPYRVASKCGAHYFLTIVDDFTRSVWVYLMAEKKETAELLMNFCKMVKTQFGKVVKCVRSDNGLEFKSERIMQFYSEHGILCQTSCVYTPQQNGRVERKHRHILNVARALRFQAQLPLEFWGECVLTAAYLINRTPTRVLENKTPYQMLFGKPPTYAQVRVFGCLCYISNKPHTSDKFEARSKKCIFVGYPFGKKGWRVFDMETSNFIVSRDVKFCEDVFPYAQQNSDSVHESVRKMMTIESGVCVDDNLSVDCLVENRELGERGSNSEDIQANEEVIVVEEDQGENESQRASTLDIPVAQTAARQQRVRRAPDRLKDFICYTARVDSSRSHPEHIELQGTRYPISRYISSDKFSVKHRAFLAAVTKEREPRHYGEAVKSKNWRDAMQNEIDALERNETWILEDLPPNKSAIGCKWVYRIKYHADGRVERYKARLVDLGNKQVEGIDYTETFAPVAKMVSVRAFLAVAAIKGWALHQMDVQNAFLHGDLHEEVYMWLPQGFTHTHPGKVCRLKKSIYGLRQAPRMWFSKLATALEVYGFVQSRADYSLFTWRKGNAFLAILVYVDDLVIAGNSESTIGAFKQYTSSVFHIKDLGQLKYFLGIEIARGPSGLFLCQRKYVLDILAECGLLGAKPTATPMEQNHRLAELVSDKLKDPEKYRRLVGRLIYLTITRPELCYSVHVLAQFMQDPLQAHYDAALRVVRFLKGNPGQGILLRADGNLQINAYCDSDWASCPLTRRSLTGYFVMLGNSPISWKTKKQQTVSRSSAEAEYRSMANATSELLWLKSFLNSLDVNHSTPMKLFCDSQAALHIATNPVFHERTKHIELDCHFVRDQLRAGCIAAAYTRSSEQLADIFTKALGKQQFHYLLGKLGICNLYAPT